jgi:Icc-related predicted phosphoesterase
MKLCIISDTHMKHKFVNLKNYEADVLVHCGDMTGNGGSGAMTQFFKWFGSHDQFKHKICIAGNHDWIFEKTNLLGRKLVPDNVVYLEDEEVVIDGVKFYGSPVQKIFCNWAFNRHESKLAQHWEAIPDDTDVLITHSPPYSILDLVPYQGECHGSPSLYKEVVERIKPKIHCFGHIHEGYGMKEIDGIMFINASNLDGSYLAVNDPVIIEI